MGLTSAEKQAGFIEDIEWENHHILINPLVFEVCDQDEGMEVFATHFEGFRVGRIYQDEVELTDLTEATIQGINIRMVADAPNFITRNIDGEEVTVQETYWVQA